MIRVYIVEDDALMRELLTCFLEKQAYHVSAYASPINALARMVADPPDLILSDVKMPEMSGPELVGRARGMGISAPAIFITADPTDELETHAGELGVSEILRKPFKDLSSLSSAVKNALLSPGDERADGGIDETRFSFLTELSHELRTPLTALKLALTELFAGESDDCSSARGKLIHISRRNLDRIISVVERQLDLLQIVLGDVFISRRLVEIGDFLSEVLPEEARPLTVGEAEVRNTSRRKAYLFTDPERLASVIEFLMGNEARLDREQTRIDVNEAGGALTLTIVMEAREPTPCGASLVDAIGGNEVKPHSPCGLFESEVGLERRAYRSIVDSLGGNLSIENRGKRKRAILRLPILPRYDRRKDFIHPLRSLREAAELAGKSVSILRCEIIGDDVSLSNESTLLHEFVEKCHAGLARGDTVVRGKNKGVYYVSLLDRTQEEVDHAIVFLRNCWHDGGDTKNCLHVTLLQRIDAGSKYPEALLASLEPSC